MTSSNKWGDDPDSALRFEDANFARFWKTAVALLVILLVAVLAAVLSLVVWSLVRDPDAPLEKSRELLNAALESRDYSDRLEKARDVEDLLKEYQRSGGQHDSAADLLLAAALAIQGRHEQVLRHVGNVSPADCESRDLLVAGIILMRMGHVAIPNLLLDELLRRPERDARVLRFAIDCRFAAERRTEALKLCQELVRLEPDAAEPWLTMVIIYETRSDWHEMVEPLRKYIELSTGNTDLHRLRLVRCLLKNRRVAEARQELDRLRADAPEFVEQNSLIEALVLHAENKSAEALELLHKIEPQNPADRVEAWKLTGKILLAQQREEEAEVPLQSAVAADPSDHEAHYLLGQAYARLGDSEQAKKYLDRQRVLRELKIEILKLEGQAEREPTNVAVRLKIAELCKEVGWLDLHHRWLQLADHARSQGPGLP